MDLQLKGKAAVVTGGSRGIGKAVARELACEGVDVAIVARTKEPLEAAARDLAAETGRKIVPIVADTADGASVKRMAETAFRELGRIDILVNGAARPGSAGMQPGIGQVTDELFFSDMNVKVLGYLRTVREIVPYMARNGGGKVVNLSGSAARATGMPMTSMRNAAVHALTKNIADEFAKQHITAVTVHPSGTQTEARIAVLRERAAKENTTVEALLQQAGQSTLIGRAVFPVDVARVVAFLCSPLADVIDGDAINVGGGLKGPIYY